MMTVLTEAAACRRVTDPDWFNNLPCVANCRRAVAVGMAANIALVTGREETTQTEVGL
jgi:hypothetical protein